VGNARTLFISSFDLGVAKLFDLGVAKFNIPNKENHLGASVGSSV
jgi:hypothetical protein